MSDSINSVYVTHNSTRELLKSGGSPVEVPYIDDSLFSPSFDTYQDNKEAIMKGGHDYND